MKTLRIGLVLLILILVLIPGSALAQTYLFSLDQLDVHVFWNEDGTSAIDYVFVFTNNPGASPIDYVDVGLPNSNFSTNGITADVDGRPITNISRSGYEGSGVGVALGLGNNSIRPGAAGRVHMYVNQVERVLYPDSTDENYASAVFSPTWFGSQFVAGTTNMSVTFHLPPGVQPDEPRWHASPGGWASEPATGVDQAGRVTYTWRNPQAVGYQQYKFGASFPAKYVPESAITRPSFLESIGLSGDDIVAFTFCCGFAGFIGFMVFFSNYSARRRKLKYLPPKIAIEGHGIKRGLTAVEAAILLEQPMDKIMTMILFATIKKNAAVVTKKDPLEIEITDPLPDDLRPYEVKFLNAFQETDKRDRREALQNMMIALVRSVSNKLKGFSRRETVDYYRSIVNRAWAQIEAAQTPEVKSEKYDQVMEWTMLDKDYGERTRDVFRTGPVFVPIWWPRYDPVYRGPSTTRVANSVPRAPSTGSSVTLPHLPGSDFAASVVNGVQGFSAGVIGNLNDFTGGVTQKTNPMPVSTSRGGSRSGGGCACACACAGCACACAGGGR